MDYQATPPTLRTAVVERDRSNPDAFQCASVKLYLESYALDTEGKPSSHVLSHSEPTVTREDKTVAQHLDAIDTALGALQAYVLDVKPDADPTAKLRPVARAVEPTEPIEEIKK